MSRFFLLLLLGACAPADSNGPSLDVTDMGTDDVSGDVPPVYSLVIQTERLAVGAIQVVSVLKDDDDFDADVDWQISGGVVEVAPNQLLGEGPGPVEIETVVDGSRLRATFEVITPRWKALSAGQMTTCVLNSDDEAYCMGHLGNTKSSKLIPVPGGLKFQAISAGASFACGISSGDVYCWGDNANGRLGVGEDVRWSAEPLPVILGNQVREISAGLGFVCASSPNKSWCWGISEYLQVLGSREPAVYTPLETATHYKQIAAGHFHACGIRGDGVAECWGANIRRQILDTDRAFYDVPEVVSQPHQFVSLHPGRFHTCGRALDGTSSCWGESFLNGDPPSSFGPQSLGRSNDRLVVNGLNTCGLTANALDCRGGSPDLGVLGTGDTLPRYGWSRVPGHWWQFDGSNLHGCALDTQGELFCWGANFAGAVGARVLRPILEFITQLVDIEAGQVVFASGAVCWLDSGTVVCRGDSINWQLGIDDVAPSLEAHPDLPPGTYTQLYARGRTICARSELNEFYCWGADSGSRYRDGFIEKIPGTGIRDLYLGPKRHHVLVRSDGRHEYWDSVTASQQSPRIFTVYSRTLDMQVLEHTTAILTESNELVCSGVLCAATNRGLIDPDPGVSNVVSVHLMDELLCIVDDLGVLRCVRDQAWVIEPGPQTIRAASSNGGTLCLLDRSGVACMGTNRFGTQLQSLEIPSASLHRIPGTAGATDVIVGEDNVCARLGELWGCWGDNGAGQMTKTILVYPSPTAVLP